MVKTANMIMTTTMSTKKIKNISILKTVNMIKTTKKKTINMITAMNTIMTMPGTTMTIQNTLITRASA